MRIERTERRAVERALNQTVNAHLAKLRIASNALLDAGEHRLARTVQAKRRPLAIIRDLVWQALEESQERDYAEDDAAREAAERANDEGNEAIERLADEIIAPLSSLALNRGL